MNAFIRYRKDGYETRPGIAPAGKIVVQDYPPEDAQKIVDAFVERQWRKIAREPVGELSHPYLVPGATYNDMWDWDAYFTACALPKTAHDYMIGSCMNLIDAPLRNGRPSKKASVSGEYDYYLHPYPLRAQFAVMILQRTGDFPVLESRWETLKKTLEWYEKATCDTEGFFRWQTLSGIDNHPAVYGRTPGTVAGVDLACFHYREYQAMSILAARLGESDPYREKAAALKKLIRTRYYDRMDRFFYDIDRNIDYRTPGRQFISWDTPLRFPNWGGLFPLWACCCTEEQAAALRDRIMDPEEFLSPAGVRSHSRRDEQIYNNELSGGPSNWQGPVWGLSTLLTVYGLQNYCFHREAGEIARRLLNTFAADIEQNGTLHEYYHGDTGQPVLKPGFLNWNLLAYRLWDNLRKKRNPMDLNPDHQA